MMRYSGVQYSLYMAQQVDGRNVEAKFLLPNDRNRNGDLQRDGDQEEAGEEEDYDERDMKEYSSWLNTGAQRINRVRRITAFKVRKKCNRNCLLITFFAITCCMMITILRLNEHLTLKVGADEQLRSMLENPFLDTWIRPENETCLVCPRQLERECDLLDLGGEVDNTNSSSSASYFSDEFLVVYFVTSAPDHWRERHAIRSSWGAVVRPKPVFIVGYSPDNLTMMELLVRESHLYEDIIVEDFVDTYRNLTLKTGFMLKQFLSLCPQADFLIKTDDDMFIQPQVLSQVLKAVGPNQVTGSVQRGGVPYRNSWDRYYLPWWLYNETVLPDFVSGWTYVLPGGRVRDIYETAMTVRLVNLEDVFFTGLVAGRQLNMTLVTDSRFRAKGFRSKNDCLFKRLAAFHNMSYRRLLRTWPRVQELGLEDCDKVIAKEEERERKAALKEKKKLEEQKKETERAPK